MEYLVVLLLALSLATDAFAVSITDGITLPDLNTKKRVIIAGFYGVFQGIMPLIGFFLSILIAEYADVDAFDHYLAFALLLLVGGKMVFDGIKELLAKDENKENEEKRVFSYKTTTVKAVATSIDAFIVGVSFAMSGNTTTDFSGSTNIFINISIITSITFALCFFGVFLGEKIYAKLKNKYSILEVIGGAVIILIGLKILLEQLGVIVW